MGLKSREAYYISNWMTEWYRHVRLFTIIVTLGVFASSAYAATFGDFEFDDTGFDIVITGYNGSDTDVIIPDTINSKFVTEIDVEAFLGNTTIETVMLPEALLFIRARAFKDCTSLVSVTVPGSVLEIGEAAFQGCSSLTSLELSDGIADIFANAFEGTALEQVVFPETIGLVEASAFAAIPSLDALFFLGNAPTAQANAFGAANDAFFFQGATGFSEPTWEYATGETIASKDLGEFTNTAEWVLLNYPNSGRFLEDETGAPRSLFLSYALNVDPRVPTAIEYRVEGDELILTYYAGRSELTYRAVTSTDLETWTEVGVTVDLAARLGYRDTSVTRGDSQFMRVEIIDPNAPLVSLSVSQDFTVVTGSNPNRGIYKIRSIYTVGDENWVIASREFDLFALQIVDHVFKDTVTVEAPELDVIYYLIEPRVTPSFAEPNQRFIQGLHEIESILAGATQIWPN
ncbi:MAG: leucine-rich repeat domain-containing protein [Verrucomicrobiota bacterium]